MRNKSEINTRSPVIPTSEFSSLSNYRYLCHGFDTINLCLYVQWHDAVELHRNLQEAKAHAIRKNRPIFWKHSSIGDTLLCDRGSSSYPYHLKNLCFDLYLNAAAFICNTPNIYVCLRSTSLWRLGLDKSLTLLLQFIKDLKGSVARIQVNRIDLCCDYHMPNGLTLDFLLSHKVSATRTSSQIMNGDRLGTFYVGSRKSGCLCRIYNKSAELKKHNRTFLPHEKADPKYRDDIWRVEFELRRKSLIQFDIDTVDELKNKAPGLWQYLTTKWLSFRLPTSNNSTRRPIHPWWADVQSRAGEFGKPFTLKRNIHKTRCVCDPRWFIAHVAGCLPSMAVLGGTTDLKYLVCSPKTDPVLVRV